MFVVKIIFFIFKNIDRLCSPEFSAWINDFIYYLRYLKTSFSMVYCLCNWLRVSWLICVTIPCLPEGDVLASPLSHHWSAHMGMSILCAGVNPMCVSVKALNKPLNYGSPEEQWKLRDIWDRAWALGSCTALRSTSEWAERVRRPG